MALSNVNQAFSQASLASFYLKTQAFILVKEFFFFPLPFFESPVDPLVHYHHLFLLFHEKHPMKVGGERVTIRDQRLLFLLPKLLIFLSMNFALNEL